MDPSIKLDRHSSLPLHQQISAALRERIRSGDLAPGTRLPTSRALARELEVNRVTVQHAYRSLQGDSLILGRVGRGTFVAPLAPAPAPPDSWTGSQDAPTGLVSASRPADEMIPGVRCCPPVERLYQSSDPATPAPTTGPGIADFTGRIPDERLFNVSGFRESIDRVLRDRGAELLQYGPPLGDAGLRAWIAARLRGRGVPAEDDEILLLNGAQQGITLVATALCQSGERVITARPTYHLVLDLFSSLGLEVRGVPLTPQGLQIDLLERELRHSDPRLIYTMPDFQNPTGITQSEETRREIVRRAARAGVPIIEDDCEHELRFRGRSLPPLAAQQHSDLVIHLGSFSKGLFPGLRVGWIHARRPILARLLKLKSTFDLSGGTLIQAALHAFIASGEYERHLSRMRAHLEHKHRLMAQALENHLRGRATWTSPDGGFAVWVQLSAPLSLADLRRQAAREGVFFTPGDLFARGAGPMPTALRLALSRVDAAKIEPGIAALGRALALCRGDGEGPANPTESIPLI